MICFEVNILSAQVFFCSSKMVVILLHSTNALRGIYVFAWIHSFIMSSPAAVPLAAHVIPCALCAVTNAKRHSTVQVPWASTRNPLDQLSQLHCALSVRLIGQSPPFHVQAPRPSKAVYNVAWQVLLVASGFIAGKTWMEARESSASTKLGMWLPSSEGGGMRSNTAR